ncbi:hypothetical protein FUA23_15380 [Neolewinella aurantiaca]|uniref:Tetratricopeptide repeat protein n=1 Tax=Neolewinella aurantiaca TaxID=2602767 RepID=A0A5C7FU19_9BACT|nr:hypothetical protein [Neolewinella aurantiaca]TXF88360.1 hypothetical protein FUA23_15380 [Neolewinella aurantiaca]
MNAKDFQLYLEQPQLLYALPLAELQGLAMEYPYSSNLRLLLLLKTHLEGHPEEQDYLNRCAAASFDRAFIYDLLQDARLFAWQEEAREETEVLELRTLDEIALEDAALLAGIDEDEELPAPAALSYQSIFPEPDVLFEEEPEPEPKPDLPVTEPAEVTPPPFSMPAQWVDAAADFISVLPVWPVDPLTEPSAPEEFAPEPVSSFSEGKRPDHGHSFKDRLRRIRRRQSEKLADEQEEVRKIARRSLVAQEDVASETLARLLVQQGQYQHAIKMYRRLELLYPDKKTIFAGLIKDLQEKL